MTDSKLGRDKGKAMSNVHGDYVGSRVGCTHCWHPHEGPIRMVLKDGHILQKCCKCGEGCQVHNSAPTEIEAASGRESTQDAASAQQQAVKLAEAAALEMASRHLPINEEKGVTKDGSTRRIHACSCGWKADLRTNGRGRAGGEFISCDFDEQWADHIRSLISPDANG